MQEKKSIAKAEAEAYASPEYKSHLEAMRESDHKCGKSQATYEALRSEFEGTRSLLALEKRMVSIDTNQN